MEGTGVRQLRRLGLGALTAATLLIGSCQFIDLKESESEDCGERAKICKTPTVRALAEDVDTLERHIERFGSVVAKQPDVWGQARLTKAREEFEKVMAGELYNFQLSLQGSLFRSDQAYYASAMALSAAVSGRTAGAAPPTPVAVSSTTTNTVTPSPITVPTPEPIPGTFDAFTGTTAAGANFSRTPVMTPLNPGYANIASGGITLEPTIRLDQQKRYLDHLNQLRRINEGDDTSDSAGYSLNLIRIPVSVLPGKKTDTGYGAEISLTLTPQLSEELLPTTFRNLVINDLVDQISVPLTQLLNDPLVRTYVLWRVRPDQPGEAMPGTNLWMPRPEQGIRPESSSPAAPFFQLPFAPEGRGVTGRGSGQASPVLPPRVARSNAWKLLRSQHPTELESQLWNQVWERDPQLLRLNTIRIPATKLWNARRPFPPSQIVDIYGFNAALKVAGTAAELFDADIPNKYYIHFPDVQGYLQEELQAAYQFLAHPANADLWGFCNPELVRMIRSRQINQVAAVRQQFTRAASRISGQPPGREVTVPLAWTIIVESALLTDQLIQDMREAANLKGCACSPAAPWMPFYLPAPPPEARQAFNEYVRCRWPIHVFALDPVAEQQNISDQFSQRREMQLSMSLAFVSGQLSARRMSRFARRIEADIETIALNNTIVGFSHGTDTFGWRFYPRYQSPDIESNFTALFRDLFIGGPNRNAWLRQRQIEPGQRECVAIVMMPSFVPYATLNSSSNWFRLTDPKCKKMTSSAAVRLGARIKAIQNCSARIGDAACYRDGDLERLLYRAKQLEERLPLQTMRLQVPYENTLGGFAMFNSGVTDLAPELLGWYGAPAINLDAPTTIFLIGNLFSVHQTHVIAGGQPVARLHQKMLSRQVMQVTIPAGCLAIHSANGRVEKCSPPPEPAVCLLPPVMPHAGGAATAALPPVLVSTPPPAPPVHDLFVDVHVATPYGVTSHLLIPACHSGVIGAPLPAAPQPSWMTSQLTLGFVPQSVGIVAPSPVTYTPNQLKIDTSSITGIATAHAALNFSIDTPVGGPVTFTVNLLNGYDSNKQPLTFTSSDMAAFTRELYSKVGPSLVPDQATGELSDLKISDTTLTLSSGSSNSFTEKLANTLTIKWVKPLPPPKAPAASKPGN